MRQVVSETAGAVLIAVFCVAIVLPFAAARGVEEEPVEAPVPEKISVVQLLHQQHQQPQGELTDWQVLQLAIAYTESRFNPAAVGKAQDSGILQITPVYVAEVNRIYGTSFVLQDAFDPVKSLEMWDLMQAHYNEGRDLERAIALHNRAPQYRAAVLQNMEWIRRYEAFRKQLKHE